MIHWFHPSSYCKTTWTSTDIYSLVWIKHSKIRPTLCDSKSRHAHPHGYLSSILKRHDMVYLYLIFFLIWTPVTDEHSETSKLSFWHLFLNESQFVWGHNFMFALGSIYNLNNVLGLNGLRETQNLQWTCLLTTHPLFCCLISKQLSNRKIFKHLLLVILQRKT